MATLLSNRSSDGTDIVVGGDEETPAWVGIHDGNFDVYDRSEAASPELERIAEDRTVGPISEAFNDSPGASVDGVVGMGPIYPGESASTRLYVNVPLGQSLFFSYTSTVLDAGTEVNDEAEATTAFLGQSEPNTGEAEGGVVVAHPGFIMGGRSKTLLQAISGT